MAEIKQSDVLLKLSLPLSIAIGKTKKRKFILNLNQFRNLHYRSLNNAKQNYSDLVGGLLANERSRIPYDTKVMAIYIYYAPTKRLVDVANPCSVIDKFTCDGIVKRGILADDNITHLREVRYVWGGVNRDNPRCDLFLVKHTPGDYSCLV